MLGFAFIELLGFRLLPRLKNIAAIKLYSPDDPPGTWPALETVIVNRPIDWDRIAQQYDTVRINFDSYTGRTVYHCHILDHVDRGMMGVLQAQ